MPPIAIQALIGGVFFSLLQMSGGDIPPLDALTRVSQMGIVGFLGAAVVMLWRTLQTQHAMFWSELRALHDSKDELAVQVIGALTLTNETIREVRASVSCNAQSNEGLTKAIDSLQQALEDRPCLMGAKDNNRRREHTTPR